MKALAKRKQIADWYWVQEIVSDVFWIREPGHCSFYAFVFGNTGVLIDSGLGLSRELAKQLLTGLGIESFRVLNTHAHCDHIGLNSLADSIAMSETEWRKFQAQNEVAQFDHYIDLIKGHIPLPTVVDGIPERWMPDAYLNDGDRIAAGSFQLKVTEVPGHTSGSLIFSDTSKNLIFLGDLIYTGALYLHFSDSSIAQYEASISKLLKLIENSERAPILLPSHNSIPMDAEFVYEVRDVLGQIRSKALRPSRLVLADKMFEEGLEFRSKRVRIILRKDEYERLEA